MTYLIYQLIMLAKRTRAAQLGKGLIILLICYVLSQELGLQTINFVLDKFLQYGIIAVIVVFQPELRRALEQVGRGSVNLIGSRASEREQALWLDAITEICAGVESMAQEKTGALIAIERRTGLGEIIATGTGLDASTTQELLGTIFYNGSPLHDGAVVIRDARVCAAGCYLPLSTNTDIGHSLGTRHRAALGMSENSDAIVIVVSEETGIISVAQNGVLVRKLDRPGLAKILKKEIVPNQPDKPRIMRFFKNEE